MNSSGGGLVECEAGAFDLCEDFCPFGSPDVRLRIGIAVGEIGLDVADKLVDGGEAAGADDIAGQVGEEALDQIEPGRRGRSEVHLEARVFGKPRPHRWMFVRGVVVGDQMQIEVTWRLAIDLLEKAEPLDM